MYDFIVVNDLRFVKII